MTSVDFTSAAAVSPFLSWKIARGIGCDHSSNVLVADGKHHLRQQTFDPQAHYFSDQLVSAAHAAMAFAQRRSRRGFFAGEKRLESRFRDTVMSARGADRPHLSAKNSTTDRGITDAEQACDFTRLEEIGFRRHRGAPKFNSCGLPATTEFPGPAWAKSTCGRGGGTCLAAVATTVGKIRRELYKQEERLPDTLHLFSEPARGSRVPSSAPTKQKNKDEGRASGLDVDLLLLCTTNP